MLISLGIMCVVYADTRGHTAQGRSGEGLGHRGGAERRAGAPYPGRCEIRPDAFKEMLGSFGGI
jgi:hypothetical protein